MAYSNSSRVVARKIMKSRGISSLRQVESSLRSYAFLAWNPGEMDSVSQYNNDLASLADPLSANPSRPATRPLFSHGLRPFRIRKRSRREISPDRSSGAGFPSKTMPPGSSVSADLHHVDRGEMPRKRDSNSAHILPSNFDSNLMTNSPSAENNPAVETLLNEMYYIIRTKKELKHNPLDIVSEMEKLIINYHNF